VTNIVTAPKEPSKTIKMLPCNIFKNNELEGIHSSVINDGLGIENALVIGG
jgi:hypothetical protein